MPDPTDGQGPDQRPDQGPEQRPNQGPERRPDAEPVGEPVAAWLGDEGLAPEGETGGPAPQPVPDAVGEVAPTPDPTPAQPDSPRLAAPVLDAPHRRKANFHRLPVIGIIAAVLLIGVLVGGRETAPKEPSVSLSAAGGPMAAPADALSSTWYCGGATDQHQASANLAAGSLVITNTTGTPLTASIQLVASDGPPRSLSVAVGPDARVIVPETIKGGTPWIAAIVDLNGGGATVEQQVAGALGTAAVPCASSSSADWYFTNGATLINADSTISLLNPYPTAAIVDLNFTTNEGPEQPGNFQAIVVPPDGLTAVNLRSQLRRRSQIATWVQVTSGDVIAWKTDITTPAAKGVPLLGTKAANAPDADPASPLDGLTVTLGASARSTSWTWPEGSTSTGLQDQYVIYNPGSTTARVSLAVHLPVGSAEPFQLTVPPQAVTTVQTGGEARIPSGTAYWTSLTSTNGVPVAAEEVVASSAPQTAVGPAELIGAANPARSWLTGAGSVSPHQNELVTILNPGRQVAKVTLASVAGGTTTPLGGAILLGAHTHVTVDLSKLDPHFDAALLVTGTDPIVVERELAGKGAPGLSLSLAVPLR